VVYENTPLSLQWSQDLTNGISISVRNRRSQFHPPSDTEITIQVNAVNTVAWVFPATPRGVTDLYAGIERLYAAGFPAGSAVLDLGGTRI
jgi:hypothetical protein